MNEAMMRDLSTLHTSLTTSHRGAPSGATAPSVTTNTGTRGRRSAVTTSRGSGAMASTATTANNANVTQRRPGTSVGYEHAPPSHLIPGTNNSSIDSFRRNGAEQNSFRADAESFLGPGHDSDSPSPVPASAAISASGGQHQSFLEQQHHQRHHPYQYQQQQQTGTGGDGDGYNSGRYESPPMASITPSCPGLPESGSSGRPRTPSGVASASVCPSATTNPTAAGGQQQLQFSPGGDSGFATSARHPPPHNSDSANNGSGFQSQYHHPPYQRQHSSGQTLALATKKLAIGTEDEGSQISGNNPVQHEYHKQQQSSLPSGGQPQRPPLAAVSTTNSGSGAGGLPPIAEVVTPLSNSRNEREREQHKRPDYEYDLDPPASPPSHDFSFDADRIHNDVDDYPHSHPYKSSDFHGENAFDSRGIASVTEWSGRKGAWEFVDNKFGTYGRGEYQSYKARTFDSKSSLYQYGFGVRGGAGSERPGRRIFAIFPSFFVF